jgi:hypothetical protein
MLLSLSSSNPKENLHKLLFLNRNRQSLMPIDIHESAQETGTSTSGDPWRDLLRQSWTYRDSQVFKEVVHSVWQG